MLSVLVVSPDPTVPGGVSVFIAAMKSHVKKSRIDGFYVGSRGRREPAIVTLMRLFEAPIGLGKRIGRKRYDVVHLNPSFDVKSIIRDGLLLLALRAVSYKRTLFYIHGFDFGVWSSIRKNAILRTLTGKILNCAALITVLDQSFRDALIELGVEPSRITITRTMFDGKSLRAEKREPSPRRRILFMSRFDPEKGARELLEAFVSLASDFPDVDLVLAGSGEENETLQEAAHRSNLGSRVSFPGYVGGEEKNRLLQECTIFALPTYYSSEGMPVAVLEAMGAGKPLLVGSAGALPSIAKDPDNGVVLREVNARTVEAGLRRLLNTPTLDLIGAKNAEIAWSKFEAAEVTADIENLYDKVALC